MLGVGVIGTGAMGRNHVRVFNELASLKGIADASDDILKPLCKTYNTKGFTDIDKFLKMKEMDAVCIATPTMTHYEIAKKALSAGKHVLLEKPMCSTVAQGVELADIAKESGLVLSIGFIERHNPVTLFTKSLIEKHQFGDIINLSSRRVSSYPARIRDVGVIMDLGVHDIDILRFFAGSEVVNVHCMAGRYSNPNFEDHADIHLEFKNGIHAHLEVNWLTPMKARKVFLTCSQNFVEMDYTNQSLEISTSKFLDIDLGNLYSIPQAYDIERVMVKQEEPLKREIADFLGAITDKRAPLISANDGINVLRIALACLESVKKKGCVSMEGS